MSSSIRQLIRRLSPVLVTINRADLLTFGSTTVKPSTVTKTVAATATATATATLAATTLASSSTPSDPPSSKQVPSSPSSSLDADRPSVILTPWSTLLSKSNLRPLSSPTVASTVFSNKRVIFFGEQHHQPSVLKAQLLCLDLLHQHVTERGGKVVVVMEMFSTVMDAELGKWMATKGDDDGSDGSTMTATTTSASISDSASPSSPSSSNPPSMSPYTDADLISYYDASSEGFDLPHYLPLLYLSRSLSIPVHGGFPPREWARVVHRQGINALRNHETYSKLIPGSFSHEERWRDVENIEEGYLAYIRSLTRGSAPVMPPDDDDGVVVIEDEETGAVSAGKRNEKKRRFTKGLPPAQTLKDTFFAWSIDRQLAADPGVVVFAVCGSGHCEFGFGAPDRVRGCERSDVAVVVSKAWGSEEFRNRDGEGREGGVGRVDEREEEDGVIKVRTGGKDEKDYGDRRIADCVVPYEMYFESEAEGSDGDGQAGGGGGGGAV